MYSYAHAVRKAAFKQGLIFPQETGYDEMLTTPVNFHFVNCDKNIKTKLVKAFENIKFTKIDINVFDHTKAGKFSNSFSDFLKHLLHDARFNLSLEVV